MLSRKPTPVVLGAVVHLAALAAAKGSEIVRTSPTAPSTVCRTFVPRPVCLMRHGQAARHMQSCDR